jgi:hypothetical protein
MEYYSAIKKNEILSFTGKWMELENSLQMKKARFRKTKVTCFFSYVEDRSKYKYMHYYIYIYYYILLYIHLYTKHVSSSGTVRGD